MPSKATTLSSVVVATTRCTLTGPISLRTTGRRAYSVPARIPGTSILINRYSSGPSPAGPANRAGPLLRAARLTSALYSPNGVEGEFSDIRPHLPERPYGAIRESLANLGRGSRSVRRGRVAAVDGAHCCAAPPSWPRSRPRRRFWPPIRPAPSPERSSTSLAGSSPASRV
jgi:hypothetical protein